MKHVFLGLGGNIGDTAAIFRTALREFEKKAGHEKRETAKILAASPLYQSPPMDGSDQPDYLNMCVELETELSPKELLERCLAIEKKAKRIRTTKNCPRTLDIDILFYGDQVIENKNLQIPHPDLQNRLFVLKPLHDIAPDFTHPVLQKSVAELLHVLLRACQDSGSVVPQGTIKKL